MSGKLKEVREKMKSVQSTQQITKAMKMVSAAKLRRSQDNIQKLRPYADELRSMLVDISQSLGDDISHKLASSHKSVKNVLLICITSDRGLCGAFNNNVVKLTDTLIQDKYKDTNPIIWSIGKKGMEGLRRRSYEVKDTFVKIAHPTLDYTSVEKCIQQAIDLYVEEKVDAVEVIYSEFKNAALQIPTVERLLPFRVKTVNDSSRPSKSDTYIFEQSPADMLAYLMPLCLKTQLTKAILDSIASEHGARMSSMDKATENANEIFKKLKVSYNRARQAAITTELSEIVAGAAAM